MRDAEKRKASQKRYDQKRSSKIITLSFRVSGQEEEASFKETLKRFRGVLGALRQARSCSLDEAMTILVDRLDSARKKTAAPSIVNSDPEAAERAAFTEGVSF